LRLSNNFDKKFLLAGKIVGVHGIRGFLKFESYLEESLPVPGSQICLRFNQEKERAYKVISAQFRKRPILLCLEGITDRTAAESLIGSEMWMERSNLPELEDGSYYWFEIEGLSVFDLGGNNLGKVISILPTGSNDVYVVRNGEKEILIPAIESVIKKIDPEKGIMVVDLPEGL
jgi:16S rRNA processing protein RimM